MKNVSFRGAAASILFLPLVLAGCGGDGHHAKALYTPTVLGMPNGINSVSITNAGGHAVAGVGVHAGDNHTHAIVYTGSPLAPTDLHPSGFEDSQVGATDGTAFVGEGYNSNQPHAIRWDSVSSTGVDLHPAGYDRSIATGVSGDLTVGDAINGPTTFAVVWTGTSNAVTILPSTGYSFPGANAISGDTIVGSGSMGGNDHALLWHGLTAAPVDLHPSGYVTSIAEDTEGTHTVGQGQTVSAMKPLLWTGDSNVAVDLTPAGCTGGIAQCIRNGRIAGTVFTATNTSHAAVWDNDGASFTDLHATLANLKVNGAAVQLDGSIAAGVDASGNVYGYAFNNATGTSYPVMWKKN